MTLISLGLFCESFKVIGFTLQTKYKEKLDPDFEFDGDTMYIFLKRLNGLLKRILIFNLIVENK